MNIFTKSFIQFGLTWVFLSTFGIDQAIAGAEFKISQGLRDQGKAAPMIKDRPLTPREQAEILVDVKGLWAETAITNLVATNIIPAFSDNTFRPNEIVTQAQFKQVLIKAFPNSGFTVSAANQKITKSQALVFIVNALNYRPVSLNNPTNSLSNTFVDAVKITPAARMAIATAKDRKLLFSYPDVRVLNPNEKLSRMDLAAIIYQALAIAGRVPPLQSTDIAQIYLVQDRREAIAQVNPPARVMVPQTAPPAPTAPIAVEPEAVRQSLRVPIPATREFTVAAKPKGSPSISFTVPTGFGASAGSAFIGVGYQSSTRVNDGQDAGFSLGVGLGDPKNLVGLELAYINYATGFRSSFLKNGGFSFKIHRLIAENTSVAIGVENAIVYGGADAIPSVYGAISSIFQLEDSSEKPFSSIGLTFGVGGGRFRSISDINTLQGTVNVFGAVAVRVFEPISLIADWNGQTLSVGASIKPFRDIPLVITPGITDIAGNNTNGTRFNGLNGLRFTLGVGYGIYF
jgi:hypothetical protein